MPASSSTVHTSVQTRRSVPFQNEQNGSLFGSPGVAAGSSSAVLALARSVDPTNGTPQSPQTVKPRRYSALHCGQIIATAVYYRTPHTRDVGVAEVERQKWKPRRRKKCRRPFSPSPGTGQVRVPL